MKIHLNWVGVALILIGLWFDSGVVLTFGIIYMIIMMVICALSTVVMSVIFDEEFKNKLIKEWKK